LGAGGPGLAQARPQMRRHATFRDAVWADRTLMVRNRVRKVQGRTRESGTRHS
jgi:hypothetical protein